MEVNGVEGKRRNGTARDLKEKEMNRRNTRRK